MTLAIVTPNLGAISETFITRHINGLAPDQTVVIAGNILDQSAVSCPVLQVALSDGRGRFSPQNEQRVLDFFNQHNVTHILGEYGCYGTDIVELNHRKLHLPLFVHFHGGDASCRLREPEMVEYYKDMGQMVTGVCVVSSRMGERLAGIGIPKEKIFYTPYGIEIPKKASHGVQSDPCRFLSIMRLVPKKAPLELLLSFAQVLEKLPTATLDIVGDGELAEPVQQLVSRHALLSKTVRLHGAIPFAETKNYLEQASVYVQHSVVDPVAGDREGLPNSILEASAYGIPVVSTKHEGILDAVKHHETGFLSEEFDVQNMAHHMLLLGQNRDLRIRFGQAARRHMEERFALPLTLEKLRTVIGLHNTSFSSSKQESPLQSDSEESLEAKCNQIIDQALQYMSNKNLIAAQESIKEAKACAVLVPDLHYIDGICQLHLGNRSQGLEALQNELKYFPTNMSARTLLEDIQQEIDS